ncbi:hypothetical protein QE385_003603 [Sphingomonas sp. SORGH_AS 950]|nr:hypothetical protein [Sphingomonas sp. SORGH_AS_0950]MDQ1159276.1 hypothetical protein [Sphingomonas sp. SORGH_AS_0950]
MTLFHDGAKSDPFTPDKDEDMIRKAGTPAIAPFSGALARRGGIAHG